jgi:hypothetical protein
MALRFYESFDHYTDLASILQRWTSYGGNSPQWGAYGRGGTYGFRCGDNVAYLEKVIDSQQEWRVGFAGYPENNNTGAFFHLYDGATSQLRLHMDGAGHVQVLRGDGTLLATGTTVVTPASYHHFQIRAKIDNSAGAVDVYIDGAPTPDISISGVDTQNSANATADRFMLGELVGAYYMFWRFDDVYALDGTGSAPYDDLLGDCSVECKFPDGNGNSSQLVGQDGNSTDNYLLVDEAPAPDDDTTYVESSTVGNKDTYTFPDLTATTGTVHAVQILPYARKTDAGTRTIATVARLSGTEVDSADIALAASYAWAGDLRTTKPGGGAWSISDVNASEFGVKVTA